MKKVVILTGSGISSESGIPTFRATTDAMWENYDVKSVCTHTAWQMNPEHVNKFYNMLRVKYKDCQPNEAHKLIKCLEDKYEVVVVTQNVDNLHEKAGSTNVVHLHGELMKCCSEDNPEDRSCWVELPQDGFGESGLEIPFDQEAKDGSLLRPYIVFFEEPVPNYEEAAEEISNADILVVIGTSLQVYPAAGLVDVFDIDKPLVIIDPDKSISSRMLIPNKHTIHIDKGASEGMKELMNIIDTLEYDI